MAVWDKAGQGSVMWHLWGGIPRAFPSFGSCWNALVTGSSRAVGNKTAFLSLHREGHSQTLPWRPSKLFLTLTLSLWSTSASRQFRAGIQMPLVLSFEKAESALGFKMRVEKKKKKNKKPRLSTECFRTTSWLLWGGAQKSYHSASRKP